MFYLPKIVGTSSRALPLSRTFWKTATQFNLSKLGETPGTDRNNEGVKDNKALASDGNLGQDAGKGSGDNFAPFRFVYPEFLPDPRIDRRNRIREKLERMDMLRRRATVEIPEFYVGSIMKVVVSDKNAPGKSNTFVGICTEREGTGLRACFTLRNVIDGHGVEIKYDMYNPTIQSIIVLKLERRLDECLRYLRDCPPQYSTFPFDMPQEVRDPNAPVPVNTLKVPLNPKPWCAKWQLWELKGIEGDIQDFLNSKAKRKYNIYMKDTNAEHDHHDLMKTYRKTIPAEEQKDIFGEVYYKLAKLTQVLRSQKKKRTFAKPEKRA